MSEDVNANLENSGEGAENTGAGENQASLMGGMKETPSDPTPGAENDKTSEKPKEPDKAKEEPEDLENQAPDKAEGYALKCAPETKVDSGLLDSFRKTALELGLTRAQAGKLAGMYEQHAAKTAAEAARAMEAEQTRVMLEARKKWEAEITASPEFEAERGRIQAALRRFGSPELYTLLDQTNLGSHPEMWKFMAAVGQALAEPGFHGENGGRAKSAAEVLYPNMNQ